MAKAKKPLCCVLPPPLSSSQRRKAFKHASHHNPANIPAGVHDPGYAAILASAYWGAKGVNLTVSFMESIAASLRDKMLSHMNAWGKYGNVVFKWVQSGGQVRISRGSGGYWSYLGTDILSIPKNQQTMNLEGFTANTPDSEFYRVIRHETGHTLGMPHEHLRPALVALLDPTKTEAYFERTQGWSKDEVDQQVLTPLTESSLLGATPVDALSIMCYQISGECTKSGQPIPGGTDIDAFDGQVVAKLYPLAVTPPPPPPPPAGSEAITYLIGYDKDNKPVRTYSWAYQPPSGK